MTQEEKAKAYDEALEQAKKELKTCGNLECDAARQIFRFFPELAESDDERIRKIITDCVFYQYGAGSEYTDVLEYLDELEKLKEQKSKDCIYDYEPSVERCKYCSARCDARITDEQKPELPLMNGDADLYFDEWRQQHQGSPTKRKCFEEGMRYAQRLQEPAEWSEEDEDKVDDICKIIEHATIIPRSGDDDTGIPTTRLDDKYKGELKAFVKSVRPQYLGDVTMTASYKMGLEAGKASHWRPSEEQMDWLESAVKLSIDKPYIHGTIISLYEQLKRL